MAFHISPRSGEPRPCKAATPESCPVGGEHFTDQKEAQSFAEERLTKEYKSGKSLSRKVDLSRFEPMDKLPNGRYTIEPGEYYVINSECIEMDPEFGEEVPEDLEKALRDPSGGVDTRNNAMVGGYIGKEPIYTVVEGWSGVANSFVTPKLYDAMRRRGLKLVPDGEKPPVVEITTPTTLGNIDLDESADIKDYGLLEVGDKKIDFLNTDESILLAERTVI